MQQLIEKAAVLMEALPYMQQFRGATIVVKFGGSVMEDESKKRSVIRDLVFMECAGMKPVVVHGGGKAISACLEAEGIETRFIHGLRYTCSDTIAVVDDVLHNDVNAGLVSIMEEFGGRPVAVSGKDVLEAERIFACEPGTGMSIDLGFVGQVVRVDAAMIQHALDNLRVPIITPLGHDENGVLYNINADMAACKVAAALQARKLVFLSDVPGLLRDPENEDSLISTIAVDEIEPAIGAGTIGGGMVPKLRSAAQAIRAGVGKVHMIDGRRQHSLLLEIFTDQGVGTQITG